MWFNFHTHSSYCDGKGDLPEYVAKARDLGMHTLGFSSHAPLPFVCNWCMKRERLNEYLQEIEMLKSVHEELEIYKGLEIDFIPLVVSPTIFQAQLDYSIGSVHFVEAFADGRRWEIDGSHPSFLEGLAAIFSNDMRSAVTRYFELTREMLETSRPTILGHFDKIKIQNIGDKFFRESDAWYQAEIRKTIECISRSGVIVEVNTRGLYQKKSTTAYPSPWVLELLHQKNIPITISSDAHRPDDLVNQFSETASMLRRIGFNKLHVLRSGVWRPADFNENGII